STSTRERYSRIRVVICVQEPPRFRLTKKHDDQARGLRRCRCSTLDFDTAHVASDASTADSVALKEQETARSTFSGQNLADFTTPIRVTGINGPGRGSHRSQGGRLQGAAKGHVRAPHSPQGSRDFCRLQLGDSVVTTSTCREFGMWPCKNGRNEV